MADKAEQKEPKKAEARDAPTQSVQDMATGLLASYAHNMDCAAPRTIEELNTIRAIVGLPPAR